MDLDALHRHMIEFKTLKPRLLAALEFVEAIIKSGMVPAASAQAPAADASSAIVTSDQLGTIRQDMTVLDDRVDVLDKFKDDVLPVLDQVPQFLVLMEKMQGFDPASIEERLTAVEGSIQEIGAALDPNSDAKPEEASGSDGATPGQAGTVGSIDQGGSPMAPGAEAGVGELSPAKTEPSVS